MTELVATKKEASERPEDPLATWRHVGRGLGVEVWGEGGGAM